MRSLSFDIFCRVVDNYGDIGVCWRLAKDLANRPDGHRVRLWVDDMASFGRIEPLIRPAFSRQRACRVEIVSWNACGEAQDKPPTPHAVVIEGFACDPPASFVKAMQRTKSLWLNLEYLSAEEWVQGCHGLPSMHPSGLEKYFFFPGFTPTTGGLIREPGLMERCRDWQAHPERRRAMLQALGARADTIARLDQGAHLSFLFCYPDAPVAGLISALSRQPRPGILLVPESIHARLPLAPIPDNLSIQPVPFVDQPGFDRLLWSCDLNFVRGEDSLVRSLWAGRPMIWQIYVQEDDVHLDKLQAWLEHSPLPTSVRALMRAWNTRDAERVDTLLSELLKPPNWESWRQASRRHTGGLSALPDLTSALIAFCTQKLRTR
ncbi:MAG: elongation factor P maturation arginine rhamnosyltransferase EarP [Candidimonas sp.]|jgi:uncharacterized repeat protein (TIGR03837 family)